MIKTILSQVIFKLIEKFMDSDSFKTLLYKLGISKKKDKILGNEKTNLESDAEKIIVQNKSKFYYFCSPYKSSIIKD